MTPTPVGQRCLRLRRQRQRQGDNDGHPLAVETCGQHDPLPLRLGERFEVWAQWVQGLQHRPHAEHPRLEQLRGYCPPPPSKVGGIPQDVYPHSSQLNYQVGGRVRLGLPLPARGTGIHELDGPQDRGRGAVAVAVDRGGAAASRLLVL